MNIWKRITKTILNNTGKCFPVFNTQLICLMKNGYFLDLRHPKTFKEKISWLKLYRYNKDETVKKCSDKYRIKEYLEEKGYGQYLNEVIAVYDTPEEIIWEDLPDSFVFKWNFFSGLNIIVKDKNLLNHKKTVRKLKKMGRNKDYLSTVELQYETEKKLLVEKYLGNPINYKFYCLNGKVKEVLVSLTSEEGKRFGTMMDPEKWEKMEFVRNYHYRDDILVNRPASLNKMKRIAEDLSKDFPFVRIDFLENEEKTIIGELSFTPGGGITPSEAKIDGNELGEYLAL